MRIVIIEIENRNPEAFRTIKKWIQRSIPGMVAILGVMVFIGSIDPQNLNPIRYSGFVLLGIFLALLGWRIWEYYRHEIEMPI